MRRAVVIAALGIPLVLASVAAGWWFLVREDAQLATSPQEIPEDQLEATATPSGDATADAGDRETPETLTFEIDSERSEAAYFVDEELASLGVPSTAKGATREVTGTFYLTRDGTALSSDAASQFTVVMTGLTSDEARRDQRVQEALETSVYPVATFTVTSVTGYDPAIPDGSEQTLQLSGVLELHGVQREVTWEVKAVRQANVISALATLKVAFAEYNITAPTFFGLVSIDDETTLQVQLIAELAT